ncbi:O-antigen ligase family protein [Rickettsiales endosymbiont of Stachyamoeba lipophora]|uniref:O-antigen ligase family protein n=1 Tax=Rickettsiales endosymbiont of Stachyamoeba lipophora TaxID=2486578 RepID=UPI000F655627|nr:O-antigen ligase family protein [Rickettsiales endosymbiont of Stachyamoeba lipophora]AZL15734.1 O-antigen ligase family protein [Rickettsiales endosymbiont of Stachyamoeba lipophora]
MIKLAANILPIIAFPIVTLGGLAAAPIYLIIACIALFKRIASKSGIAALLKDDLFILLLSFSFYSVISVFIGFNPLKALASWFFIWPLILSYFIVNLNPFVIKKEYLIYGFIFALILAFFEVFTDGTIIKFAHQFAFKPNHSWFLHDLNRGMTFLAMIIWPIILKLNLNRESTIATILFMITLYLVGISDSLSAAVALMLSATVFVVLYYFPKLFKIYKIIIITSIPLFFLVFYTLEPTIWHEKLNFLPLSAIHRFFIWHHCASRIIEYPFGVGFNGSRFVPFDHMEVHDFWGPLLPLHPHNLILQFTVEFGWMGLIFLIALTHIVIQKLYKLKDHKARALAFAMFTCYYIIALISYGIWQQWWISVNIISILLFKKFLEEKNNIKIS